MKRKLTLLLTVLFIITVFTSCDTGGKDTPEATTIPPYSDPVDSIDIVETDDLYDNYYHIWVGSFNDSNGDEIGDIPGITEKLDYIKDMGFTAIWLSPIGPSTSYHKYSVMDYYDVDEDFGTLEDYDELIDECDKRGIKVILDLVLNHISSQHPWFIKACDEVREGNFDGYAKYFEFRVNENSPGEGFRKVSGTDDVWYEGNFSHEMPEWDLTADVTRTEFEKIAKFWLDRGAAGFRLDAVKFFENNHTDGIEFLKWFYEKCNEIKPETYIIGENWDSASMINDYYESGVTSQFAFKFAADGTFVMASNNGKILSEHIGGLRKFENNSRKYNENRINAYFLSNHDMVRSANMLRDDQSRKFAAALYLLTPGNTFTYYGEELGIESLYTENDAWYRTPMVWDGESLQDIYVPGVTEDYAPDGGGVKQQEENENSLLNFYKRALKIRNQNPGIARGILTDTFEYSDEAGGYILEYNNEKLLVVFNSSKDAVTEIKLSETFKEIEFRGGLTASDPIEETGGNKALQNVLYSEGSLTMPPKTAAVLKVGK